MKSRRAHGRTAKCPVPSERLVLGCWLGSCVSAGSSPQCWPGGEGHTQYTGRLLQLERSSSKSNYQIMRDSVTLGQSSHRPGHHRDGSHRGAGAGQPTHNIALDMTRECMMGGERERETLIEDHCYIINIVLLLAKMDIILDSLHNRQINRAFPVVCLSIIRF